MGKLQEKIEASRFISYPTYCVVGVVDDKLEAEAMMEDLAAAGLRGNVSVLQGPEGADEIDASGSHHGLRARIVRLVQFTTMDGEHSRRYESEARAGHWVIMVHLDGQEEAESIRRMMKAHGGHFINWYGRFHFETLDD